MSFEDEVRALIKAQKDAHAKADAARNEAEELKRTSGAKFAAEAADLLKRAERASDGELRLFTQEAYDYHPFFYVGLWKAAAASLLFRYSPATGEVEYSLGINGVDAVREMVNHRMRESDPSVPRLPQGFESVTWRAVEIDSVAEDFVTKQITALLVLVWPTDLTTPESREESTKNAGRSRRRNTPK
jgi:hypothetical protein